MSVVDLLHIRAPYSTLHTLLLYMYCINHSMSFSSKVATVSKVQFKENNIICVPKKLEKNAAKQDFPRKMIHTQRLVVLPLDSSAFPSSCYHKSNWGLCVFSGKMKKLGVGSEGGCYSKWPCVVVLFIAFQHEMR